ncbi:MAG: glutamate-5-semialdehyde dehydrogenase [Anaerolineaceae bacterium]
MLDQIGINARAASRKLALASASQKTRALLLIADRIWQERERVLTANRQDISAAAGLSEALVDRLMLNESRLSDILTELRSVAGLPDPAGEVFEENVLPNGLRIHKQRVPLGVLAVIYEARPNVTVDISGLAVKSGNAAILRGGKETLATNRILAEIIRAGLEEGGLPADAIQFIDNPDRGLILELLKMDRYVDMVIPRGGAALHTLCRENSRIPVITGGMGICHLFVDESANLDAALPVITNAKVQRPSVCNALDTVLVHEKIAVNFIPRIVETLSKLGVTFRADPTAAEILSPLPAGVQAAGSDDFDTEWMSLVLGIKVVSDLDEALEHIADHSTAHSDGILTQNQDNARTFVRVVDSAAVYVNASTRFTDGAQFGLGAEVAVSTVRLHARGPMGLRELTTYKWVVEGEYHVRK